MSASPHDMQRYVLRPSRLADLPQLERLASASAIGISSLPADRDALLDKLHRSSKAFANDDDATGEETYLFVLEDQARGGELIGTAGIAAGAGFQDRFYSYRNEFVVQVSPALGARNRIHTLHLCHDLTGVTLLTGFHIDSAYEGTIAPQVLSRGRLMFIAQFPERFADRIAAENPGLADDSGRCPFWDAVGRRFFNMDYPAAESLTSGRDKAYIAELMPQSPIYVPLLPEEAQWAIGQLHPVAELPFSILMDEGFDGDTYINLFDGGPTADGRVPMLKTVAGRRIVVVSAMAETAEGTAWHLFANTRREDFRVIAAPITAAANAVALPAAVSSALLCAVGDRLAASPLAWGSSA